ncbi:MAG TPA: P1 family peptidase [Gaiellaceae bacterium]|nr:P1 family peptidase [Gaiellaceae bacterium]
MAPLSNDTADLVPRTEFDGRVLRFDLPGLEVGVAEYDEGPTGCTVFHFPGGAACATDVRGGSSGTLGGAEWVRAICFAGGSLYGLEAGAGVAAELLARGGYEVGWTSVWPVSAAIIFDFRRESTIYPDKELGRAALRAARPGVFPLGARGAGRSATVGKTFALERGEPAGQGGAFRTVGPTRIAVFVVVNAFGAIVDRDGTVVRGHLDTEGVGRLPLVPEIERRIAAGETPGYRAPESTTLTLVVTNQRLERRPLRQLGRQVHASLARAIQPFHSLVDGDVLYVATTNEVENPALDSVSLGVVASELAWDAVLACFDTD